MTAPAADQVRAFREHLARTLQAGGVLTAEWRAAYDAVPRHQFLPEVMWLPDEHGHTVLDRRTDPERWWQAAYQDVPLVTQFDDAPRRDGDREPGKRPTSSNSMPTMVFGMLKHLDIEPGQRVLEIGTGTGWNAALLAARLGDDAVVTIELDPDVASEAQAGLRRAGHHVAVVTADGAGGWPARAPYDRVICTASVTSIPPAWIEQCRPGGVIVVPWVPLYGGEGVVRLTVTEDGIAAGPFVGSSAFMPLRAHRFRRTPHERYLPNGWPGDADKSTTTLSPTEVVDDWITEFAIGVQLRDVYWIREDYEDGTHTLWLYDAAVTAWASVDWEPGRTEFEVHQSGPRRLWDEVTVAWRWWQDRGRPEWDRFGLTVTEGGEQVWLDKPTQLVALPDRMRS